MYLKYVKGYIHRLRKVETENVQPKVCTVYTDHTTIVMSPMCVRLSEDV